MRNLEHVRFVWWQLALAGLLVQLLLFADPIQERVGAEGPFIYVLSTLAVLVALLRNLRLPGLAIIAVGAILNLVPVLANGGYMPSSPEAWLELTGVAALPVAYYSNVDAHRSRHAASPSWATSSSSRDRCRWPRPSRSVTPSSPLGAVVFLVERDALGRRPSPACLRDGDRSRCTADGGARRERPHALKHDLRAPSTPTMARTSILDRGDGVLELMASIREGEPVSPSAITTAAEPSGSDEGGLLRRWLPGTAASDVRAPAPWHVCRCRRSAAACWSWSASAASPSPTTTWPWPASRPASW